MSKKYLVRISAEAESDRIRETGCEVLVDYPSALLVRATDEQESQMRAGGFETTALEPEAVETAAGSFSFEAAVAANEAAPVTSDPDRDAYYLVRLAGPAKGEWLEEIYSRGGTVQSSLPGFVLLVGLRPSAAGEIAALGFVESITPYRAAMKISPKLQSRQHTHLEAAELAAVAPSAPPEHSLQVEISVFRGEDGGEVAESVRGAGGSVLSQSPTSVTAILPPGEVVRMAENPAVSAILPHAFAELHNDRATEVMRIPADRQFGDSLLQGADQLVAVADSGLDSGDVKTIHADFAGRISGIESLPTDFPPDFADLVDQALPADDGPTDVHSGHGTHVSGSVLGNGAAARSAGSQLVPQGTAPGARLFFQAIEQTVAWKSPQQLLAVGILPPQGWPPPRVGLYGIPQDLTELFQAAYDAGARIHTNSWGASVAGIYNDRSAAVDRFMWEHRDMLILFSAGNSGKDTDVDGTIDRDSIGAPGTAKNCLTVGASENDRPAGSAPKPGLDRAWTDLINPQTLLPRYPALGAAGHVSDNTDGMAAFSSRGPTDDGRVKPDVVAPGTNVLSARTSALNGQSPLWGDLETSHALHGLYCWSGGTSMSTPLVAGAAALVRELLVRRFGSEDGVHPSGALIKALLVNGARPMAGQFFREIPAGPNPVNGFGLVDLDFLRPEAFGQTAFVDDPALAVTTLETRFFELEVSDVLRPAKVTLVWTDAPGQPTADPSGGLRNRLYLEVREPDGTVRAGDLTPYPNPRNNVQQVSVETPVGGVYEIRVHGIQVLESPPVLAEAALPRQDFALVASNVRGFRVRNPPPA